MALADLCITSHFNYPSLFGASFSSLEANLVTNYSQYIPDGYLWSQPSPSVDSQNSTFCNVTTIYTHPGYDDKITVETWLPVENYNGRLQAVGGSGWTPGRGIIAEWGMTNAVHNGYATVTTDAGVPDAPTPDSWALKSPGNMDLPALQNFGFVSLHDEAVIAKSLIKEFYGRGPLFSYWNGCSQGGRQGMALAQQYPTTYDGIMAAAPAMNYAPFVMSTLWPAFYMQNTKQYPQGCELDRLTTLAVSACDELDGVEDGIIAEPEMCLDHFNPEKHVGESFTCHETNATTIISASAADVASAIWRGPQTSHGKFIWYGFDIGSKLSTIAPVSCNDGSCTALGQKSFADFIRNYVDKDPDSNVTSLSHREFDSLFRSLKHSFGSLVGTDEIDLNDFKDSGGKLMTFHGLVDEAIPSWNSLHYFKEVSKYVENTNSFFQYYRAPGLAHCAGGPGGQPTTLFSELQMWVENGTVPTHLPVTVQTVNGTSRPEILCPYPKKAIFDSECSDTSVECWSCA